MLISAVSKTNNTISRPITFLVYGKTLFQMGYATKFKRIPLKACNYIFSPVSYYQIALIYNLSTGLRSEGCCYAIVQAANVCANEC